MRYIFFAAFCTLGVISAVLALPAFGEPHARLVNPDYGNRLALVTVDTTTTTPTPTSRSGRQIAGPAATVGTADGSPSTTRDDSRSFGSVDVEVAPEVENAPETSSSTTTPTTTSSTTTTSAPPPTTTTTIATTTTVAATGNDTGGVIVSDTGIVLPVLGPAEGGLRVTTPCGNETIVTGGERVHTVDIVLDAGHGGDETGAVSPAGDIEKTLNLRIAAIVEWYLEEAGYSVLLTRTTDIRLPLQTRADIANAVQPRAFISIHHNGGATKRQDTPGSEVFVDGGNPEARRLGGLVFEELTSRMASFDADWVGSIRNGVSARLNEDGADLYGLHRFTPGLPSVITEVGYLSNASEAALYVDNDVQWAHGRAIADGVVRWLTTGDGGSGYLPDFVDSSSSGTGGFAGCVDPAL